MKSIKVLISAIAFSTSLLTSIQAQNYKSPAIDASGKVTDVNGKFLGSVSKEGIIKNSAGKKIAEINSEGTLIDTKTGKKLGKAEKNGNLTPQFSETADDKYMVSEPINGTCEVKDQNGKTVVIVHENYKHVGACAYHCLSMKKEHKEMKMK